LYEYTVESVAFAVGLIVLDRVHLQQRSRLCFRYCFSVFLRTNS